MLDYVLENAIRATNQTNLEAEDTEAVKVTETSIVTPDAAANRSISELHYSKLENLEKAQGGVVTTKPKLANPKPHALSIEVPVNSQELPVHDEITPTEAPRQSEVFDDLLPEEHGDIPINVDYIWETVGVEDNKAIYEDFSNALLDYIELQQEVEDVEDIYSPEASLESVPLQPIIISVSERLELLEPDQKEQIVPILQNIIDTIDDLLSFEDNVISYELTDAAHSKLEDLCIELFEALGIDYDDNDVDKFISVILKSDFELPVKTRASLNYADLASIGTHEAKKTGTRTSNSSMIHSRLQQILGMFVLIKFTTTA